MRNLLLGSVLIMLTASHTSAQDMPLNVSEWSSAIEIIERAKSVILEEGWYQIQAAPGKGQCLATGLEKGWQELDKSLVDFDYARLAVNRAIDAPALNNLTSKADPLSTPYWGRYYMYWNDAPGRTETEVVEALDTAIAFAKAERAAALESRRTGDDLMQFDNMMMQNLGFAGDR